MLQIFKKQPLYNKIGCLYNTKTVSICKFSTECLVLCGPKENLIKAVCIVIELNEFFNRIPSIIKLFIKGFLFIKTIFIGFFQHLLKIVKINKIYINNISNESSKNYTNQGITLMKSIISKCGNKKLKNIHQVLIQVQQFLQLQNHNNLLNNLESKKKSKYHHHHFEIYPMIDPSEFHFSLNLI